MTTPALDIKMLLSLEDGIIFGYVYNQLLPIYGRLKIKSDWRNYIVFEGDNPNTLVAHVDTCTRVTVNIKQKNNIIYNPNAILGADDRAGVYGLIKVAQRCKKKGITLPTLVFTNYEETGGKGVKALIAAKLLDTSKTRLFVELDRKGCNEYVFYSWTLPKPVKKYVESFGFVKSEGSYSDITDLTTAYEIPAVNLSIGYYHQHTAHEKLHIDEMEFTINRVVKMMQNPISQLHVCKDEWKDDINYWDAWDRENGMGKYRNNYAKNYYLNQPSKTSTYYDYDADKRRSYEETYSGSSDNYYIACNTAQGTRKSSWIDKKYELRRELMHDGYVYSVFEDIYEEDFDAITDLESVFQDYAPLFPDDLGRAFEIAWTDTLNRYGEVELEAEYSVIDVEQQ